jgi:hypothetical protein
MGNGLTTYGVKTQGENIFEMMNFERVARLFFEERSVTCK